MAPCNIDNASRDIVPYETCLHRGHDILAAIKRQTDTISKFKGIGDTTKEPRDYEKGGDILNAQYNLMSEVRDHYIDTNPAPLRSEFRDGMEALGLPVGEVWETWYYQHDLIHYSRFTFQFSFDHGAIIITGSYTAKEGHLQNDQVRFLSDILYLTWNEACKRRGKDLKNLKLIIVKKAVNYSTLKVVKKLFEDHNKECSLWPGWELSMDTEGAKVLLGCPSGIAAGRILSDHGTDFPGKTIGSVTIFGKDDRDYNLVFKVVDLVKA